MSADIWGKVRSPGRQTWPTIAGLALLCAALSLWHIGNKPLWFDEGFSVGVTRTTDRLLMAFHYDGGNMLVYYVLLHFWERFGMGTTWLRSLSVIPAVLSVPALYALVLRLWGERAALISAALLAINVFALQYAREARSYSLAMFVAILATWCFVRCAMERPLRPAAGWVAYALVTLVGAYAHLFALLLPVAHMTAFAISRALGLVPSQKLRWPLVGLCVLALGLIPLVSLAHQVAPNKFNWISPLSPDSITGLSIKFAGGSRYMTVLYLLAIAISCALRGVSISRRDRSSIILLLAWLCVPVIIAVLYSIARKPVFVPRYFIICLPAFVALAGIGLARIRDLRVATVVAAVFLIFSARAVALYYSTPPPEDWRPAAAYVHKHVRPGDSVLVFIPAGRFAFSHAYDEMRGTLPSIELMRGALPNVELKRPASLAGFRAGERADFVARTAGLPRVWLVLNHNNSKNDIGITGFLKSALSNYGRRPALHQQFDHVELFLYARARRSSRLQ